MRVHITHRRVFAYGSAIVKVAGMPKKRSCCFGSKLSRKGQLRAILLVVEDSCA